MIQKEILYKVIQLFEKYKIDYMISGSFASNLHGVPRATFDADIVIKIDTESLKKFSDEVSNDFYVEIESADDIIKNRKIFNVIHYDTGFKIDLIPIKKREFSEVEFHRRQMVDFMGMKCWFSSAEDTLLTKLEWAKMGNSERQFQDALGIVKVQSDKLDWVYLNKWAKELGVLELLEKTRNV